MRPIILSLLCGALSVAACSAAPPKAVPPKKAVISAPLTLVQNGRSPYTIVIAADAIPAEQTAARELSEYLGKISGVVLPVKKEGEADASQPQIVVGQGVRAKALLPKQDWAALGLDGIVVKTVGRNLVLAGGRPRGSLYAVYSFLEDTLGVRWWARGEETVPAKKTVLVPPQNLQYVPQFETREVWDNSMQEDPHLAAHSKVSGTWQLQLGEELGGRNPILGFCHTFDQLLPVATYFAKHPEWYSDPDNGGKPCTAASRIPNSISTQLCMSNEAARLELTKNALEMIRKSPQIRIISISQNDSKNKCNCPADLALEKREGSASGPLLHFVNKVAADIDKEFPGYTVDTLAYQYTEKPPRFVRAAPNVVVRLCAIEADFSRPLYSEANKEFRDNFLGWKKSASRLAVWDYTTNFLNWMLPYPNLNVLAPNIRFFAANNVVSMFEQGDGYSGGVGDFVPYRSWLLAKLLWNPALDEKKLTREFLSGYYGAAAAPHLIAYFDVLQKSFFKRGTKLASFHDDLSFMDLPTMNAATRHFNAAQAAVAGNPDFARRLRRERLSFNLAWILRYKSLYREAKARNLAFEGPKDIEAFVADYAKTGREFKVKITRGGSFEEYVTQLTALIAPDVPLPVFLQNKSANDVIDAQEGGARLTLTDPNRYSIALVEDPKASNGKAVKMTGNSNEWALQCTFNESNDFLKNGPWRVYVVARVETKPGVAAGDGPVVSAGLWDAENKVEAAKPGAVPPSALDGEYHAFDLGLAKLNANMYFWATPPQRPDIAAVSIDRFILVREPAAAPSSTTK